MNCLYDENNKLVKCYCLALRSYEPCRCAYLVDPNRYNLDDYANQSDADYAQEAAISAQPIGMRIYYALLLASRSLRATISQNCCAARYKNSEIPF